MERKPKTKSIEQSLLADLKVEGEANIASLQITIDSHQKSLDAALEILNIVFDPAKLSTVTDSIAISIIGRMDRNMTYDLQLGTLNSIINSGKMDYISNKELRYKLASLKDKINDTNESANTIEKNRPLYYYPISAKYFMDLQPNNTWKTIIKEMFKNPEFVWYNEYFVAIRTEGKEEETALLEEMNSIIKLIDSELK